jgi:hypothetical protein
VRPWISPGDHRGPGAPIEVWVINLAERTDRMASIRRQERLHRLPPVRRFEALRAAEARAKVPIDAALGDGAAGLIGSFSELIAARSRASAQWLIVLEDDALLVPGFRSAASLAIASAAERGAIAVQLGWIHRLRWRSDRSFLENLVVRTLRPRLRARILVDWVSSRQSREQRRTSWGFGTHALAVDASRAGELLDTLQPFDAPLDLLFMRAADRRPSLLSRSRVCLATQRLATSDIGP